MTAAPIFALRPISTGGGSASPSFCTRRRSALSVALYSTSLILVADDVNQPRSTTIVLSAVNIPSRVFAAAVGDNLTDQFEILVGHFPAFSLSKTGRF
jgi:hypothetical protein